MVRLILRLIILIFLMESTWAAAAQYCRHELGLTGQHFGHHTHQHKDGDPAAFDQTILKVDSKPMPSVDSDCPYCHLGAMKSMLPVPTITPSANAPPHIIEILQSFPQVIPLQPERPNWLIAA